MTVFFATGTLGAGLGALLWRLGGCSAASSLEAGDLHAEVLGVFALIFVGAFCATPIGPIVFERIMLPLLGALLFTVGISGLVPLIGSLTGDALLADACDNSGSEMSPALIFLGIWLLVALFGILYKAILLRPPPSESGSGPGGSLIASLLPGAADDNGLLSSHKRGEDDSRFQILCKAILAPEGTDQSHLTANERALVKVCREDEFERDRVLWGGGLL
eukprot:CAMPEP_0170611060 /NCGR_PEP_ID=MMETSP0224-20130122/22990_1 /TAXON_ID=285029 /ORGANISM="Togula jolla, Strain CCCM 725" /LENGTH=218 /DNA_ID=CAMNT_0010936475 /DNA_START=250 /DNA_END=906 /DNA_ORIENTATION=+